MIILNGKKLANKILNKLKKEVKKMPVLPTGRPPIKLVVVLVGKNPASLNFIKQKQKAAEKIGIDFKLYKFNLKINTQNFLREISKIIKDKSVTGIVIQLPLPTHIDLQKVLNLLPKNMDVDALSVDNYFVEPPIVSGIIKLLEEYKIGMKGKKIVIVGQGKLVGKPLAKTLKQAGLNLKTYDIRTKNLGNKTLEADILISATGQPHLIKESMVKKGAVVIDAGFAKINNKIVGDVDSENVKKRAGYITPVPGGVGPMTVAILMSNLIKLAKK